MMKLHAQILALAISLVFLPDSNVLASSIAIENEIRILGIYDGPQNQTEMTDLLDEIEAAWNASALSTSVTVRVVNGGVAVEVDAFSPSGSLESQWLSATSAANNTVPPLLAVRDQYGADVVIAFGVPEGTGCGTAPSGFLAGLWNPVAGIDTSGSELAFVGVAAVDPGCQSIRLGVTTAAHAKKGSDLFLRLCRPLLRLRSRNSVVCDSEVAARLFGSKNKSDPILKVARTIADLAGNKSVSVGNLTEAVPLRSDFLSR